MLPAVAGSDSAAIQKPPLGGPMFWADRLGLAAVYDTMKRLHEEHGEWLKPASLLQQLAQDGKGFSDLE